MYRFIDFLITTAALAVILFSLRSAGVSFNDPQFWLIVLAFMGHGLWQYVDGMTGFSRQ